MKRDDIADSPSPKFVPFEGSKIDHTIFSALEMTQERGPRLEYFVKKTHRK